MPKRKRKRTELRLELFLELAIALYPLSADEMGLPHNFWIGLGLWVLATAMAIRMIWILPWVENRSWWVKSCITAIVVIGLVLLFRLPVTGAYKHRGGDKQFVYEWVPKPVDSGEDYCATGPSGVSSGVPPLPRGALPTTYRETNTRYISDHLRAFVQIPGGHDVIDSTITFANDSEDAIDENRMTVFIRTLRSEDGSSESDETYSNGLNAPLSPGDKDSFSLLNFANLGPTPSMPISCADLTVVFSYRLRTTPPTLQGKSFRFVLYQLPQVGH